MYIWDTYLKLKVPEHTKRFQVSLPFLMLFLPPDMINSCHVFFFFFFFASMGILVSWVLTTEWEQKSRLCSSVRWEVKNETRSQVLWRATLQRACSLEKGMAKKIVCFGQKLGREGGFLRVYNHSPILTWLRI